MWHEYVYGSPIGQLIRTPAGWAPIYWAVGLPYIELVGSHILSCWAPIANLQPFIPPEPTTQPMLMMRFFGSILTLFYFLICVCHAGHYRLVWSIQVVLAYKGQWIESNAYNKVSKNSSPCIERTTMMNHWWCIWVPASVAKCKDKVADLKMSRIQLTCNFLKVVILPRNYKICEE